MAVQSGNQLMRGKAGSMPDYGRHAGLQRLRKRTKAFLIV